MPVPQLRNRENAWRCVGQRATSRHQGGVVTACETAAWPECSSPPTDPQELKWDAPAGAANLAITSLDPTPHPLTVPARLPDIGHVPQQPEP